MTHVTGKRNREQRNGAGDTKSNSMAPETRAGTRAGPTACHPCRAGLGVLIPSTKLQHPLPGTSSQPAPPAGATTLSAGQDANLQGRCKC